MMDGGQHQSNCSHLLWDDDVDDGDDDDDDGEDDDDDDDGLPANYHQSYSIA